jgi:hypothetical protein
MALRAVAGIRRRVSIFAKGAQEAVEWIESKAK